MGGAARALLHLLYSSPRVLLQTDYFHLFICVAIVVIYGDDVIEQQLPTDQMLLHFSNLAMHMNGELVLRKVNKCPGARVGQAPEMGQGTQTPRGCCFSLAPPVSPWLPGWGAAVCLEKGFAAGGGGCWVPGRGQRGWDNLVWFG